MNLNSNPFKRGPSRLLSPGPMIIQPAQAFSSFSCPGRKRSTVSQDLLQRASFGNNLYRKKELHTRFLFQIIKGEDFKYCLDSVKSLHVNMVRLSKTNLPWHQSPSIQADFRQGLRRQYNIGKVVFGSPNTVVDPIQPNDTFQAGGNLLFTVGHLVHTMISNSSSIKIHNLSSMGRWCGITIRGCDDNHLSVITAC